MQKWKVSASGGRVFIAQFFLPCTGFAAKRYIPEWQGIEKFRGTLLHPSDWPKDEVSLKGKKVAIIG